MTSKKAAKNKIIQNLSKTADLIENPVKEHGVPVFERLKNIRRFPIPLRQSLFLFGRKTKGI